MIEKVINLENVSLIDFLGVENKNIEELATAFPKSKIISRGSEIKIKGAPPEILRINDIVNSLLEHYHRYGQVTQEHVQNYLQEEYQQVIDANAENTLVHGTRGFRIKPKTPNQKELVEAATKNDLVFAIGPAGTGKTYISVALAVRALKNKDVKKDT